jgi:sterol 3beta-glucosyltransferase
MADQPFWGSVIAARGVGPKPLPQRRLTAAKLAAAIATAVQDATMQRRAAELGQQICGEDGIGRALAIIGTTIGEPVGI